MGEFRDGMPPRGRRIGFRLAVVVVVGVVVGELLALPVWDWISTTFHGDGGQAWYEGWTLGEGLTYFGTVLCIGLTVGGVLGLFVSQHFTGRLRRMASIASSGGSEDEALPGPYPVSGDDEITRLAQALNHSRTRAGELLETLTRRDTARSEWVAQVSHDLRTPLAALRTCLDHADARLSSGQLDAEELRRLLAVATDDAERVSNLASDLLEIARLETEPDLRREVVLPFEIAERTLHLLEPLVQEREIRLELTGDRGLPELEADGRLICRALENLLINSLEYAQSHVELRITGETGAVRFTVFDDGRGLAIGNGRVSFADLRTQRSRADSAGIGLMVTQRVASVHGGDTGARNREGGGAEVWFEVATPAKAS